MKRIVIFVACLLLTGCTSVYVPIAKTPLTPTAQAKKVSAIALPAAKMESLATMLPKLNPPRTLSLAWNPVAGADRYALAWGTNATTQQATNWTPLSQVTITNLPHAGRLWIWVKAATGPYESPWSLPITFSAFATAWQMSATGACKLAVNFSGPWTARTNYSETITNGYTTGSRYLRGMTRQTNWLVTIP